MTSHTAQKDLNNVYVDVVVVGRPYANSLSFAPSTGTGATRASGSRNASTGGLEELELQIPNKCRVDRQSKCVSASENAENQLTKIGTICFFCRADLIS